MKRLNDPIGNLVACLTQHNWANDWEVIMFPQTWGGTDCGHGDISGRAMTDAYTVVI